MAAKIIIGQIYSGAISKFFRSTIDIERFMLFTQMTQFLHYATLLSHFFLLTVQGVYSR